jgi:hypothetical protein
MEGLVRLPPPARAHHAALSTEETWEPAATLCKDVPELIKTFARNPRLLDSKTRPLLPGLLQVFCTSRRSPLTRLKQVRTRGGRPVQAAG